MASSSDEKGKAVYFCVRRTVTTDDLLLDWYATDLSSSSDSGSRWNNERPSPTLKTMPPDVPPFASAVALDSVIYVLGGSPPNTSKHRIGPLRRAADVFYLDTRGPDGGWKKAPSMRAARIQPAAFAVDGKIYVFGGNHPDDYPYAEVFDPHSNGGWEALPQPHKPLSSFVTPVHAVLSDEDGRNRRLLVNLIGDGSLYSYNLDSEKWTPFDEAFGICCYPFVAVGDVLYCYEEGPNVFAYDLVNRKWFSKPVQGLEKKPVLPPFDCDIEASLVHIGNGKLCLAWSAMVSATVKSKHPGDQLRIFRTIFTVDARPCVAGEATTSLVATIESSTVYKVAGDDVLHCLAL